MNISTNFEFPTQRKIYAPKNKQNQYTKGHIPVL